MNEPESAAISKDLIKALASLTARLLSCHDVGEIGALFVSEMLKFIPANEVILDVNTYDFSR